MTDDNLDPIFEYNMTVLEAKAYQIGILWLDLSRKYFPNYKHTSKYPKKGDPRKCSLFKHCYKLLKETNGIIEDYGLFIKAQLQILKNIQIGKSHPLIEPGVLTGPKAWKRWKVWEKKFNIAKTNKEEIVTVDLDKIKKELEKTKEFLQSRFDGSEEEFSKIAKDVERWIILGRISPFYAVMSPWVKKYCKLDIDLELYPVNGEAISLFNKLF